MKTESYTYVKLQKENFAVWRWVPSLHAIIGNHVAIHEFGEWDDNWTITQRYEVSLRKPEEKVAIVYG